MKGKIFKCHKISEGCIEGEVIISKDDVMFYLIKPETGEVIEPEHDLENKIISNKILIFPSGKGSSVVQADGLYQLKMKNNAPKAMIIQRPETVLVASAIIMEIPMVDKVEEEFYKIIKNGDRIRLDATNGKIEIYPNGALGGDVQLTESVAMGTIDMALPSTSVLTSYTDNFGILDMPYLFTSSEAAFNAMDGKMGEYFNETLKSSGLVNLGYTYNGPRSITNSVREVKKPEDLKGIKVRVMESPVFIDFFRTLGANPTPMSFTEVYTALQQGAVEAQENPPSLIFANKFYEVQKFLSITEHVHNFLAFIMNAEKFNSLSDEQKAILQEKAKKYIENQRKMELEDNNKYIELLGTEGKLKVNILTADEKEEFKKALQPMYDKYKKNFGDDLFNIADEYNK